MATLQDVLYQIEQVKYRIPLADRHIQVLPSLLSIDEKIIRVLPGTFDKKDGVLVATTLRLIFISKGVFSGQTVDITHYNKLDSLKFEKTWKGAKIIAYTESQIKEVVQVEPKYAEDFVEQVAWFIAKLAETMAASEMIVGAINNDVVSQLEKLAKLRDQGILSEEEFNIQKRKILDI